MKTINSRAVVILGFSILVIALVFSASIFPSYARDLELTGNDSGLVMEPRDESLFDLENLGPGDTKEMEIAIRNSYSSPFDLSLRTERIGRIPDDGKPDLLKQLLITIYYGNQEIYSGSMKDFATDSIGLGGLRAGGIRKLRAVVHLPGEETGNEFQGESAESRWIFTATADEAPIVGPERPATGTKDVQVKKSILPRTGQLSFKIFYILGSAVILLGMGLIKRNRNS